MVIGSDCIGSWIDEVGYVIRNPITMDRCINFAFLLHNHMDCHGCDRIVVGFTTTYAISAYHH